jgi:ABC-type uncharacterized transport system permease subunit
MTETTTPPEDQKRPSRLRTAMSGTAGITFLSIVMALVIGAFFIAFSDPAVQEASSYLFAKPMDTISAAVSSVARPTRRC